MSDSPRRRAIRLPLPPSGRRSGARPGDEAQALLARVGARVRAARLRRGDSRVALAARSGVSLRFLAQLESGAANISLLRLQEVAAALECGLQTLVGPEDGDGVEPPGRLVALLGLRGAGKSTVGARLAQVLHVPFFELDALIEQATGLSLAQIFELQGEAYYRRVERETLARFLATTPAGVLATGGGIVTDPETFAMLRRRCTTVWLRATPELHWQRVVRQGDRRPMRGNPAAMQDLRALLATRRPLYAAAGLTLDTTGRTPEQVTTRLLTALDRRGRRAGASAAPPAAAARDTIRKRRPR